MNIVKHIKDFRDGVFDALITAPIAIGTGIRDWQLGTGNYYMEILEFRNKVMKTSICIFLKK